MLLSYPSGRWGNLAKHHSDGQVDGMEFYALAFLFLTSQIDLGEIAAQLALADLTLC